ncbi:MAG: hypothetical protein UU73_C0003G0238 [Candidatus Daviesbacteria bacterium GW2011_GWA1_41_61]|uniref:Uncharacterized protein n=1 Tax=Candidatus Daviesbacteria bacterium GW2011_GWA2_40_9 TaxID=1618424 RepID=A0A0G0U3Y6_9BACT|nr:MAG: hypothetical protein UU29_C0001G0023 [Candidatus Daviesbacteria bacterium GW2011_GWA2_40_9]KKR93412.1 MAG: hypothetical protein UU44_C0002G0073 [Candidatus Daviesbacteria bacterium GW2011_GWB1_41_15]KKS15039.1 MAG: hypothetical protein UU73_C0003G0238 [Candidatus Daviesbacteria bacterium GW2011_GWA1_41_61]
MDNPQTDDLTTEEVKDNKTAGDGKDQSQASVLINLEQLIKSHISGVDRLKEEVTKHKGMLDDILANDQTYKEHTERAKEASKIKAATRAQIMKQPQVAELAEKVKSMKVEINEMEDALSDYLKEYQRMSGVNEIEGEDGEVREIVYVAKLIKKFTPGKN